MNSDKQDSVKLLSYPDNVRKRPGMYLGSTEECSMLLREIIDNSLDEGIKYDGLSKIVIYTDPEKGNIVADNGRGIPIALSEDDPTKTQLELAMLSLHAGSNFSGTSASIGLNGVGASAVNAVSERFMVFSKIREDNHMKSDPACKDKVGQYFYIECKKGILVDKGVLNALEMHAKIGRKLDSSMNTITYFLPDLEIMDSRDAVAPIKNLRTYAFVMNKVHKRNIKITVNDELINEETGFYKHMIDATIPVKGKYNKEIRFFINFEFDPDLSVQRNRGSVNTLIVNKGIHIDESRKLIKDALKEYFSIEHNLLDPGLKIFVVIMGIEPKYTSQTKENLSGMDGYKKGMIFGLRKVMYDYVEKHAKEFRVHVERLNMMYKSTKKASRIEDIKEKLKGTTKHDNNRYKSSIPSSVKDCTSSNRKKCEIFIVEGNSAGGNLMKVRNLEKHALFFLRGNPMNSAGNSIGNVLENREMRHLVQALGMGVNEVHQTKNVRYGKIIIVADADPDGAMISAQIVGFFCKHMTFAIEKGMVYVCETPIFIQGDKYIYPSDDPSKLDKTKPFLRIKGLGELPAPVVKDCILNPEKRRLRQLTNEGVAAAIKMCTSGNKRKKLMIKNGLLEE